MIRVHSLRFAILVIIIFCAPMLSSQDSSAKVEKQRAVDSISLQILKDSLEKQKDSFDVKNVRLTADSIINTDKLRTLNALSDTLEKIIKKPSSRWRFKNLFRFKRA